MQNSDTAEQRPWVQVFLLIVSLLYILLFVYAALSKLLDYQVFHRQLAMSPVLTSHADWLTWFVPSIEMLFAVALAIPKTRILGMFGAFNLMVAFTVYIYLIMNYASHVPCSCGGVLEKMGWVEHFYFNLVFVILAIFALYLDWTIRKKQYRVKPLFLIGMVVMSICLSGGTTIKLFLISEQIVHYENRFQRRYPHPVTTQMAKSILPYNSYYIAGFDGGRVYLGNVTAPLHLLSCNSDLSDFRHEAIKIDTTGLIFSSTQVRIQDGKFYLINGTVPYIYQGNIMDWIAKYKAPQLMRFTLAEPLGNQLAIRTYSQNGNHILGTYPLLPHHPERFNPILLGPQNDGVFDSDGTLLTYGEKLVYIHFYRNQYIVSDSTLRPIRRDQTIDTIRKAQIKVGKYQKGVSRLDEAPLLVNRKASLYKNLLFVNSQLPGHEDLDELWKEASIIDVYDIRDGSYRFSFPLHHINGKKFDSFKIFDNHIFLINEKHLVRYDLKEKVLTDYE